MSLFDDLPGIISDVLNDADLGFQTVTVTSITAGTYDPTTGTTSGGSTLTATVRAVVEDYKGLALLPGSQIQAGDKKVTVAAVNVVDDTTQAAFAPKPTDTVTVGGVALSVISLATTQPGSAAVIYEIQARRA